MRREDNDSVRSQSGQSSRRVYGKPMQPLPSTVLLPPAIVIFNAPANSIARLLVLFGAPLTDVMPRTVVVLAAPARSIIRACFASKAAFTPKSSGKITGSDVKDALVMKAAHSKSTGFRNAFLPVLFTGTVMIYAWQMRTKANMLEERNRELVLELATLRIEQTNQPLRKLEQLPPPSPEAQSTSADTTATVRTLPATTTTTSTSTTK
jgi:hypothetical protein